MAVNATETERTFLFVPGTCPELAEFSSMRSSCTIISNWHYNNVSGLPFDSLAIASLAPQSHSEELVSPHLDSQPTTVGVET